MDKTNVRKPYWIQYLLFIFSLLVMNTTQGQQGKAYAVHANIIYHFTKYIDWPDNMKSGEFVIGILGDAPLYDELKRVTENKMVGSQKIVVKQFSSWTSATQCHILFISDEESDVLKKIVGGTLNKPILLVTETEGAARKGACINFVMIDDRLRLEFSKTNLANRNLNIATELLKLGTVVK